MTPVWASADSDGQASFHVYDEDGCAVVVATGEIDIAATAAFSEAITVAAKISPRVVVDLASVSFVDSTGLGVLIKARRGSPERRSLCLVHPPALVRKVLRVTMLEETFGIYDTWQEAAASAWR